MLSSIRVGRWTHPRWNRQQSDCGSSIRSRLFVVSSCQFCQHRWNDLRQWCLWTTSPALLPCARLDHATKSRSDEQVRPAETAVAATKHAWLFSLLSKSSNNDPYQPMINAFHAFLIRNDPVIFTWPSFDVECILFRAVRSNYFDDFSIPSIRVSWTTLSHSLEYSLWMILLSNKVTEDLHSIDADLRSLESNDLTRQLLKKIDIYNYYFSFLKLVGVWNKVRSRRETENRRFSYGRRLQ